MKVHKLSGDTIIFNTGRPYSDKGQVIILMREQDGSLVFYDYTRDVLGHLDVQWNGTPVPAALMQRYDQGYYSDVSSLIVRRALTEIGNEHADKVC